MYKTTEPLIFIYAEHLIFSFSTIIELVSQRLCMRL